MQIYAAHNAEIALLKREPILYLVADLSSCCTISCVVGRFGM